MSCFLFFHDWQLHDRSLFDTPPGHVLIIKECSKCGAFRARAPYADFQGISRDIVESARLEVKRAQEKDPAARFYIGEKGK